MFEKLIKEIQKFINTPFRYSDLVILLDKKKDFLLSKNILENSDEFEYCAMWDMMIDLEEQLKILEDKNLVILSEINIQEIYRYHLNIRKIINMKDESKEQKEARLKLLMEGLELTKSGYAGIDKNGNKVDRRKFPDAVPLQYNPSLGIPHPKEV